MRAPLVYVVGASGSGKDSLLRYARTRLADHGGMVFAHRYITRAADAGGENHVALSNVEFACRRRAGLFALDWESHGHAYGIGIEIDEWLAAGLTVVVNGSREFLPTVQQRYPGLVVAWIDVSPEVLRDRLHARGREDAGAIEARLNRGLPSGERTGTIIRNDGALAEAGEALVALIRQHTKKVQCA